MSPLVLCTMANNSLCSASGTLFDRCCSLIPGLGVKLSAIRRRAAPRQRRQAPRQIRRRVRQPLADRMPLVGIPALALGVAITLSASQAALCLGRNHD